MYLLERHFRIYSILNAGYLIYAYIDCEPWSEMIRGRRLSWLGHLMRLHPQTPARKAL